MTDNAGINVSVSSHYREDSYGSETVTQGILGEQVEIIKHHPLFSKIRQEDGYVSWISTDQLAMGDISDYQNLLDEAARAKTEDKILPGDAYNFGSFGLAKCDGLGKWNYYPFRRLTKRS